MANRLTVDISELESMLRTLKTINQASIEDIDWVKHGNEMKFSEEDIESFKFMGLNNIDILGIFKYSMKLKGDKYGGEERA